jgi:methyl-accepting chemotaxis protein
MGRLKPSHNRNVTYAIAGLVMGILAPVFWTVVRLILFFEPDVPFLAQVFGDITKDTYNAVLYAYMGGGTAVVMACLGFIIGRAADEKSEAAEELKELHEEVASQKELFEHRYQVLDTNIKNFHYISHRIQKSTDILEVLRLCAEGLHDVLGYERVNILLADSTGKNLTFVAATGSDGFNPAGVTIPLDDRGGIIYKAFCEKKLYLVDDISTYTADFFLKPPFDSIKPLRSRSFVLCPIVVRGESVGIFGIDNKFTHRSLNDTDVDTVRLFADQAALAITRIDLLQTINTLIREMESTFTTLTGQRDNHSRYVYQLRSAVGSLTDGTTNIASGAESVMASVDDASTSLAEISVATDEITRNIEYLAEHLDKSVAAMEEMNATIKNVQQSAAVSHEVSSGVKSQAENGSGVVSQAIEALAEIQRSVERSAASITRLSANSSRIEGIIEVINEVTKRTNLLALNASIIAAQAGEYGRSFGVVADEIRNLSLQTGRSTEEITSIIEEIMGDSRAAADSIIHTKNNVHRGVLLGQDAGKALKVILDNSVNSMERTEEIKRATEEQALNVQLLTRSMEDISTMTSQITTASREQSSASKSIVRSVESIKEMTQQMVQVTGRQVGDGTNIHDTVEDVSRMMMDFFDQIERRREESAQVVRQLETMEEGAAVRFSVDSTVASVINRN